MEARPQIVLDARARLGEGPVWDEDSCRLYWVDIYNHRVHQFDPATGHDRHFPMGEVVSAVALSQSRHLLAALRNRLVWLDTETGEVTPFLAADFASPHDTRFNDGKCDALGRFWIGTMSETDGQAVLYRCDPNGALHVMETGLTISNGLGWSPDGNTFYLTDSARHTIYAYDFDLAAGALRNRRPLVDLSAEGVAPDGLSVDTEGRLWSALWGGWAVACFNAQGRELHRIRLPVPMPTSVAFGGSGRLFVTSASVGLGPHDFDRSPMAGDLFCIAVPASGLPACRFGGRPIGSPQRKGV